MLLAGMRGVWIEYRVCMGPVYYERHTALHIMHETSMARLNRRERGYGERQLCMEEQLLPQYPPVMACFSAQAITSGLKDVDQNLAKVRSYAQLVARQ